MTVRRSLATNMLRSLLEAVRRFRSRRTPPVQATEVRGAFQARYHQFKLLLNANNKALEAMARLEQARHATEPFGMPFIRGNATEVSVSVAQIIRAIEALAPGKYGELWKRFREIEAALQAAIAAPSLPEAHALVLPLAAVHRGLAGQVGGKMANLGEVANRLGLAVPAGFVGAAQGHARVLAPDDPQAPVDR